MSAHSFAAGPPDPSKIPSELSVAAYNLARTMRGVSITLSVLSFLLFAGRIWTRTFPVFRMGADDYAIAISYVLIVVDSALLLSAIPFMFGKSVVGMTLQDAINSQRYAFIAQPVWSSAMAGVKISVLLMLLRLQIERRWRRFCWGMIGFVLLLTTYNLVAQLTQCIPQRKNWDLLGVVPGRCWDLNAVRINLYVTSILNCLTDCIIAFLPITFLSKMQRPLRERIIIGILMGLGVFAGVASIVKMIVAAQFGKSGDSALDGIRVGFCSLVEENVGFISACVPCLRSPFQKCLEYLGLVSTRGKSSYDRGYGQMYGDFGMNGNQVAGTNQQADALKMKDMLSADAASEEIILPSRADNKSGQIWCTTEVEIGEESRSTASKVSHDHERVVGKK